MTTPIQSATQLASHLRSLRRSRGLTQAQLGEILGVNQARIAKIERDPGAVSVAQLLQLATALGAQITLQPQDTTGSRTARRPKVDW